MDYHWPGNVRELRNVLERAAILCDGGLITSEHLALNLGPQPYVASAPAMIAPLGTTPAAHTASAAEGELRALGLTRHQLYVRMRKYGFD